jgi:hypothetical protein
MRGSSITPSGRPASGCPAGCADGWGSSARIRPGDRPEIALALRHLRRDGWARVTDTLLHEMVHQWQAETGRPLGHGRDFREKCREVGIEGRAVARLANDFRSYLTSEE